MALIKWRESYSTGIEQFDKEHRKIVVLVNDMFEAVRDNATEEEISKILSEVISYTEYHFNNEEEAMAAANFDGLEEHRQEHENLKAEALKFKDLLDEDLKNGTKELYHFLREWLTNHILDTDMKYSGKLNS